MLSVAFVPISTGPENLISPIAPLVVVALSAPVSVKLAAFATVMLSIALNVAEAAETVLWKAMLRAVRLSGPFGAETEFDALNVPVPTFTTRPAAPFNVVMPPSNTPAELIFAEAAVSCAKVLTPVPAVCVSAPSSSTFAWKASESTAATLSASPATGPMKVMSSSDCTAMSPVCALTCWRKTMSPAACVVVTLSVEVTSTSW